MSRPRGPPTGTKGLSRGPPMAGLHDIAPTVAKRCVNRAVLAPMRAAAAAAPQPAWPPPITMTSKRESIGQSRMARFYRSNRRRSKYAWRGDYHMFHVKHGTPGRLLPDTEIAKNHV